MKKYLRCLTATALFAALPLFAAGSAVAIVTGPNPPKLEQQAATEVAGLFGELFGAIVKKTDKYQPGPNAVLIGSPKTNPAIAKLMGKKWPKLTGQGHLLKSVKTVSGTTLVVGGGSPVATYWAAAELGHHFGVRRLLHADFPPMMKPKFSLAGLDLVLEPSLKVRAWRTIGASPAGQQSWSLADHRLRLRQLAKLKFNHVVLAFHAWQPFVHFEHGGIKKETGVLWHGRTFRVDGETAGRAAFGRDRVFTNPDFKDAKTYQQRVEVGVRLARGIIAEARSLGMTATIEFDPRELPREFAPLLPKGKFVEQKGSPSVRNKSTDPKSKAIEQAQIAAYRETYPNADAFILRPGKRAGKSIVIKVRDDKALKCLVLEIGNGRGNVLPQFDLGWLHQSVQQLGKQRRDGFVASCQLPDDLNTSVYYLSRAGFDADMTHAKALDGLVTPICGAGVGERIAIGFDHLAKASNLVAKQDPALASLRPQDILRHYRTDEPVPEWWAEAKNGFVMAMNEMYRANTRARGGAREYSLYLAKRFEFALHYFTCLESTRLAGIAKAKKDKAGQLENLDKAVEAMHNALGAMADVDRNNGDRGVIAVLNEYGFRPLLKELEKADQ